MVFCVDRSREDLAPQGEPVVYFFHGMSGSSKEWEGRGYASTLKSLAQKSGFPAMTFVSFDTNGQSFFSDYKDQPEGGRAYETWFINEFVPMIEKNYGVCTDRSCKATAGFSMGGFGAIKTALRHQEMFSVTAASCPALAPFNVHESNTKWNEYFSHHPIGTFQGSFVLDIIRSVFPTREIFDKNDPSMIVDQMASIEHLPKLYFDMGGKDKFGFQEGYARFKQSLDSKKAVYESYFIPNETHGIFMNRQKEMLGFLRAQLSR